MKNKKIRALLKKSFAVSLSVVVTLVWSMTNLRPIPFFNFPPEVPVVYATSVETFTTTTTWQAPTGVSSVQVEAWGGGGAGGGGTGNPAGGGGGAGGAYIKKTGVSVTAGNTYTVTVGAATNGTTSTVVNGNPSWFSTTGTAFAPGGPGGNPNNGAGGTGTTTGAVGDVGSVFAGGNGASGTTARGGGGGGGAGSTGAGGAASTTTAGTGTADGGGNGGAGRTTSGAGSSGSTRGGGGGGGLALNNTDRAGGDGAAGAIVLTYNRPVNAPSQDAPLNAATGVSITPTFTMTTTDADTTTADNIGYKVTIYSNSACTSVVSTHDQASSSTGWSGTDASCTANPTSCYASGTQASFALQAGDALSSSTEYWWKASAKDPDGNGTFVDSSTCNSFTTEAAAATTYTQNDFEWFVSANSTTLTDPWPSGSLDLAENSVMTTLPRANQALRSGDKVRIKMNFTVAGAVLSASTQRFQLQYSAATDCTTADSWTAVGDKASGGIWRLFDEAAIGDSTAAVNNISTSNSGAEGYYSEINPSAVNPNEVTIGQNSEWDWPVENNGAGENTTYCFRMVKHDGASTATAFDSYNADSYPKLSTAPGTANIMRHGGFFQDSSEKGFYWTD